MFGSSSILEMSRLNSLKESRLAPRKRTDIEALKKIQLDGSVNANGCYNIILKANPGRDLTYDLVQSSDCLLNF